MTRSLLLALLLSTTIVHADTDPKKTSSLDHYKKGRTAYAAGSFDAAIVEFERAYQEHPAPEYLHDIGQAYRRLDKCEALSYFERYLIAKPDAKNRDDVQRSIASLRDRCAPPSTPPPTKSPSSTITPSTSAPRPIATRVATREPIAPTTAPTASIRHTASRAEPSPYSLSGSTALLLLDTGPVVTPAVPQLDLGVRRTMFESRVTIAAGASLSLAAVPYDDGEPGAMWLVSPQLGADASYPLLPRFSLVGGARLGALVIAGLGDHNPYSQDGMASSPITTIAARFDLGVAYQATDRIRIQLSPLGVQWSPRRAPLANDIPSIRAFAMSAGVVVGL